MIKKLLTLASVIALSLPAHAEVVNVFNWYDYIPNESLEKFTQSTGIKLNYDIFDSNEMLEAKLLAGNSGYDVVVPTGSFLERQKNNGIYLEIDKTKIKNYKNLDPQLLNKVSQFDPDNKYGVPYAWGTIGLGYNLDMIKARLGEMPINSLDLVFKPEYTSKLADCGIALLDSPSEIMAVAFNYLGIDPNSEKKSDLKKAEKLIKQVRGDYKYFNSSTYLTDLANGDICLALGYSGGVLIAQSQAAKDVHIEYAIPKEGTSIWFDMMAIPADAPNPNEAHAFINHILEPEIGASISNFVFYPVPNIAAQKFVKKEIINNKNIFPSDETKESLFVLKSHTNKFDRILNRTWTNLKTNRS